MLLFYVCITSAICPTFHKVCIDLNLIQVSVTRIWLDFFHFLEFLCRVRMCLCVFDFYLKANGFIYRNLALLRDWDLQSQTKSLFRKSLWKLSAALLCFANDSLQRFANGLPKPKQIMEFGGDFFFFFLSSFFLSDTSGVVFDTRSKMVMSQGGTTERMKEKVGHWRRCAWRKQRALRDFSHRHTWNVEPQHWGLWSGPEVKLFHSVWMRPCKALTPD